uniref:hypothetical protein n=1 Tax=Paractinoplanes polyasparticus TaxID=2856853 RepID=UPI001C86667C|nr:hypothetical protein [Actinoplanes polyasparticus]
MEAALTVAKRIVGDRLFSDLSLARPDLGLDHTGERLLGCDAPELLKQSEGPAPVVAVGQVEIGTEGCHPDLRVDTRLVRVGTEEAEHISAGPGKKSLPLAGTAGPGCC